MRSYYLRFRDAYRQAAIDLTLGQPVSPDLLVRPEEPAEEGSEDVADGDDQQEKEENLKQLGGGLQAHADCGARAVSGRLERHQC